MENRVGVWTFFYRALRGPKTASMEYEASAAVIKVYM